MSTDVSPGDRLSQHRAASGYVKRAQFMRHLAKQFGDAAPSDRLVAQLERDEKTSYGADTIRGVDLWYGLTAGTFGAWLRGETAPAAAQPSDPATTVEPLVEVMDLGVGALTGRGIVSVKIKALGVDVSTTFSDGEDRAAVIAQMLAGLGIEGADSDSGGFHLPVPSEGTGPGRGVENADDDLGSHATNGAV